MKKHSLIATSFLFTVFVSFTSFSGQWIETNGKWYYMTDDGNFAKDTWLWLDENHDTKGELYHFDADGAMSQNTSIEMSDGYESFLVNIDGNGAATGYTETTYWGPYYNQIENRTFPKSYSVKLGSNDEYVYSLDLDHYDFKEKKGAVQNEYGGIKFKELEDCYSAKVELPIFLNESTSELLNYFDYGIQTVAKFSKNCKVREYPETDESQPISEFLKKDGNYNCVEVISVDDDGYITDCAIFGAM